MKNERTCGVICTVHVHVVLYVLYMGMFITCAVVFTVLWLCQGT